MSKRLLVIWLTWVFAALTGNAQELNVPQKVSTSTGIYDVQSPEDIHRFSAKEIRELVRMESGRAQNVNTFPHPILVYCFEERTFRYTGGKYKDAEIKYRLHTPKTIRLGKKYPLIVHLHGNGDDSLTHLHPILPMLIGPEQQDCFVLATQGPRSGDEEGQGWYFNIKQEGPLDITMAALEHVIAENPIDSKRITVSGISGGGYGAWELISRYPDMFAGAVPTACSAPTQIRKLTALKHTPVWAFGNKGDRHINRESIQAAMHAINNSGGSMVFTELNVPGHNALIPAILTHDCLRWALAQKRGSWFSPPPGIVIHKPYSLWLTFVMFVLPFSIIVFLSWRTIRTGVSIAYQSVRK
jgi:predicted esterase